MFQQGNKLASGGRREGAGRKPKRITQYKQWFDDNPHKIVKLLEMLYTRAIDDHDREAAIYIIDRVAGKPKQTIDQRTLNVSFTADDYVKLLPMLDMTVEAQLTEGETIEEEG